MYYSRLYVGRGLKLLVRNRMWSLICLVVITALLFSVYVMVSANALTKQAAAKVDDQLVVTAFIKQDTEDYKSVVPAQDLAVQAQAIPGVKSVRVVSEEETRERFKENLKNLKTLPAAWVFQEALEIRVTDSSNMEQVRQGALRLDGIESATYLKSLVKKLTVVSGYLQRLVLGGALLSGFLAILIVVAVVRVALASEERSIAIMASIGGSSWSIITPLLVYMLVITIAASLLASLGGYVVEPHISGSFGRTEDLPDWLRTERSFGLLELWPFLAVGSMAVVSAIVIPSVKRYIKRASAQ